MTELVQHAVDAISLGSLYALYALGIALIFGVMQLINFAHGELVTVGAFALIVASAWAWPLLLLTALVVTVIFAVGMERVAFRPVRGADPTTLLVTSFAVSYLLQNLFILIFGALPRSADVLPGLSGSIDVWGVAVGKLNLVVIALTAVLLASLSLFLKRTATGMQMRAAAEDFEMARLLGVRANRVIAVAFALSGLLAGVAAILLVARTGTVSPTIGVAAVLVAFIATILGGMGSLVGAVLGGFGLGIITTTLQIALPVDVRPFRDVFVFAIVIVVLVLRPEGLIATRAAQRRV
jgi:branched-chain amino acid transport system permease protein